MSQSLIAKPLIFQASELENRDEKQNEAPNPRGNGLGAAAALGYPRDFGNGWDSPKCTEGSVHGALLHHFPAVMVTGEAPGNCRIPNGTKRAGRRIQATPGLSV